VPLLTVATLIALVDLALTTPESTTAAATAPSATPVEPSPVTAPPSEPLPTAQGDAGPSPTPQVLGAETYAEQGAGTVSVVDGSSPV
jgi:hypothetical protein